LDNMFKINDEIIVNLDEYVDTSSLVALKPQIEYAIALHFDKAVPSQYVGDIFLDKGKGFLDITDDERVEFFNKYPYLKDLTHNQLLLWLRYHLNITYGQSHLHVISSRSWEHKHLRGECDKSEVTESFLPFLDWVESQQIFSSYGRVNLFLNEPGCSTPIHHDPPHKHISPKDQFIWITLGDRKKFFVYDENTGEKHYANGTVSTFDNHNYHGSDPGKFANWSIRVDGVFSEEFLTKTGMFRHFQ